MILLSACLGGDNCKYNGGNNFRPEWNKNLEKLEYLPVCPEILGGLPVPRPPCEIKGGSGIDVLAGYARVIGADGSDFTDYFLRGAYKTLLLAKNAGINTAVFKSRSPSCGSCKIYDGTFSSRLMDGDGVTAALLKLHNIKVVDEEYLLETCCPSE